MSAVLRAGLSLVCLAAATAAAAQTAEAPGFPLPGSRYEDVTVPAGTFKAFRPESTPGENSGVRKVIWYALAIHLFVRRQYERGPRHFLGPAQGTFELVEFQAPR